MVNHSILFEWRLILIGCSLLSLSPPSLFSTFGDYSPISLPLFYSNTITQSPRCGHDR
ncbi:hypothetical protein Hanom_Chr15g01406481 [Helianthus anomalus]